MVGSRTSVKTHVEIRIRLASSVTRSLHDILRHFVGMTAGWKYPAEKSRDYQTHHRGQAGFAVCDGVKGLERASVAVANVDAKKPHVFVVTNIIPAEMGQLSMDDYNAIGMAFASSFRRFLRAHRYGGSVQVRGPEKDLADIIRGARCRELFDAWLHTPTPISHPSDIEVLHRFICALFRYGAAVRSYELGHYLVEDRGWKQPFADAAVAEIEKGLEILRVDRSFRRWR